MVKNRKKNIKKTTSFSPKIEKIIGIDFDNQNRTQFIFTNDMLYNQISREARKIAKTFDKLCKQEIAEMSLVISRCMMYQHRCLMKAYKDNDELSIAIMSLLWNACSTFIAAVSLLRNGFTLQPGILIRNIIETISMALYLFTNQNDLEEYQAGKISSSKTISVIKKMIGPFGEFYGYFSAEFAHIGGLQRNRNRIGEYTHGDEALATNLLFLKSISWLLDISAQLLCFPVIRENMYWKFNGQNEDGNLFYTYEPSEDVQKWVSSYLQKELLEDQTPSQNVKNQIARSEESSGA